MSKTEIYIGIHSGLSIAVRRRGSERCDCSCDCDPVFLNLELGRGVFSGERFRVV
jgi:hypothetical protein